MYNPWTGKEKLIFQSGIPHAGKLGSHRCEKFGKYDIVRGSPIRGPPGFIMRPAAIFVNCVHSLKITQ